METFDPLRIGILYGDCSTCIFLAVLGIASMFVLFNSTWSLYRGHFGSSYKAELNRKAVLGQVLTLPSLWYLGSLGFLREEYAFIARMRALFPHSWLRLRILSRDLVIVFGEKARKVFLNHKTFSFLDGYALMHPTTTRVVPSRIDGTTETFSGIIRQFMRSDILQQFVAPASSDVERYMGTLGVEGIMDPFVAMNELAFTIVSRIGLGNALACDKKRSRSALKAMNWLRDGSSPSALILPYFPTPARIRTLLGALSLYRTVSKILEQQTGQNEAGFDVVQMVLDESVDKTTAVMSIIMVLFAAHENTSRVLCWLFIILAQNPVWLKRVQEEIDSFVTRHEMEQGSMASRLAELDIATLEESLPTLDRCLTECIRLVMDGTLIRRNVGEDLEISGRTIRKGDFIAIVVGDTHRNEAIYPDPYVFDPDRKQNKTAFLGWGGGSHPCTGQRVAKVMVKIMTALFLQRYTVEAVDRDGLLLPAHVLPVAQLCKIGLPDRPVFLHYTLREKQATA